MFCIVYFIIFICHPIFAMEEETTDETETIIESAHFGLQKLDPNYVEEEEKAFVIYNRTQFNAEIKKIRVKKLGPCTISYTADDKTDHTLKPDGSIWISSKIAPAIFIDVKDCDEKNKKELSIMNPDTYTLLGKTVEDTKICKGAPGQVDFKEGKTEQNNNQENSW